MLFSRVDGNHRLHYSDGQHSGFKPIDKEVSFCLAYDLNLEQEISLFRDINDNQRRMNTSHLDNIEARLTGEERLKRQDPQLYIARKLGSDKTSPLCELIYEGGKKTVDVIVPLRNLKSGITYMFSRAKKLTALQDADAQYKVIKNYFDAVKKWQPYAWQEPKKYIILRGTGLWAICFIGADVIDRTLSQGSYTAESMKKILDSGKNWDWSNTGDFRGYGGRDGALKISNEVISELQDQSGFSIKTLFEKIMED